MKILIATDGSEFSRTAIEKACGMILMPNHEIRIISVFEDFAAVAAEPFAVSAEYVRDMDKIGREQATGFAAAAEALIRQCFPKADIYVTTKITKGAAARAIVEEAEDWEADLIVVGSHGYGFWGRTLIGSVSQSVINHAPCSVFVARQGKSGGIK